MSTMLNVEKWAQSKPPLIAAILVQLVTFSDFLYEILPQAKDRRLFDYNFPLPDLLSWYRLYRSPLKPLITFVDFISECDNTGAKLKELIFGAIKLGRLLNRNPNYLSENPPSPEVIKYWADIINFIYTQTYAEIRYDLNPQPVDPKEKSKALQVIDNNKLELGFFFLVYVPSLLIYQTCPRTLYRKALSGDTDSIEKLLKLDPLMLHEPAIGQRIQALRFSNSTNDYERLIAATHKLAITNYTEIEDARKRSKVELASIISALSHAFGYPLNSTQIADLFDAYSKDKMEFGDTDLPGAESLDKAIKRHSPPWHDLFQSLDNKT